MLVPQGLAGMHGIGGSDSLKPALKRSPSAGRLTPVSDFPRPCDKPGYQRNTRGPSIALASVGIAMPRTYQTANKGTVDSGQRSA